MIAKLRVARVHNRGWVRREERIFQVVVTTGARYTLRHGVPLAFVLRFESHLTLFVPVTGFFTHFGVTQGAKPRDAVVLRRLFGHKVGSTGHGVGDQVLKESVASHNSANFFCVGPVVLFKKIDVETVQISSSGLIFIYEAIERLCIPSVVRVVCARLTRVETLVIPLWSLLEG
jgi:hypothetical protein